MSGQNNIINVFNEEKAKFLVRYLLENDIISYKKLIPEIESLNSNDFYNLFKGIKYDYDVLYKEDFKNLAMKFNNFIKILEPYYEDPKYYSALQDLWINNVCIEDLRQYADKGDSFINKIKLLTDKYEEWPDEFKRDFYKLVRSTTNTKIYELKEEFKKKYNSYYKLTKELLNLKHNFEYKKEDENVSKAADNLINSIFGKISVGIFLFNLYSDYAFNKAQEAKGLLLKNELLSEIKENLFGDTTITPNQIFNELKKLMENDMGENRYILDIRTMKWNLFDEYPGASNSNIINIEPEAFSKGGDLDNTLDLKDKIDSLLKDDLNSWGILALSFINLGWSIYNLNEINKEFGKLKIYDEKLESIRNNFYDHKQKLQDLPDTLNEARAYINEILSDIRDDQVKLDEHIQIIYKRKKKQESIQNQSKIGMIISGILGVLGIGKAIYAAGGILNILSIGSNVVSGVAHLENYAKSKDIVIKLEQRLNKAIQLNNEINKFIDQLVMELEKRKKKEISKFFEFEESEKELNQKKKEKPKTFKLDDIKEN